MPLSTDEQGTDPQLDELRAAGCATILEEHAFGADRSRPVLARLLRDIRAGETLVVVQFDRLNCPVSHMLVVIDAAQYGKVCWRVCTIPGCRPRQAV